MADEIRTAEDATGGGGAGEPVVEELPLAVVGEDQGVCGLREGHTPVGVPAVVHAEDGV